METDNTATGEPFYIYRYKACLSSERKRAPVNKQDEMYYIRHDTAPDTRSRMEPLYITSVCFK